jgi:cytochrome c
MKNIILSMMVASLMVLGSAMAVEMPAAGKTKCGTCHLVDKKKIGPAFKAVSEKYKDDKNAAKTIEANIKKGGSFGWKLGKMPARGMGASDADITTMAEFIAGLVKKK